MQGFTVQRNGTIDWLNPPKSHTLACMQNVCQWYKSKESLPITDIGKRLIYDLLRLRGVGYFDDADMGRNSFEYCYEACTDEPETPPRDGLDSIAVCDVCCLLTEYTSELKLALMWHTLRGVHRHGLDPVRIASDSAGKFNVDDVRQACYRLRLYDYV